MKPTRIIAIRHGETLWNTQNRIQGHTDIDLNANGYEQARLLGELFCQELAAHRSLHRARADASLQASEPAQCAAVYCSDLRRAVDTAEPIARALSLPLTIEQRLRERHFGDFEGKTWSEIESLAPEVSLKWHARDPHWRAGDTGESLLDLQKRVQRVVNDLASKHQGSQIVIVSHGGVMDMLYRWANALDLQVQRSWTLDNTALNTFVWTPEHLELLSWGDKRHLG